LEIKKSAMGAALKYRWRRSNCHGGGLYHFDRQLLMGYLREVSRARTHDSRGKPCANVRLVTRRDQGLLRLTVRVASRQFLVLIMMCPW
jgi:hypothetical protein